MLKVFGEVPQRHQWQGWQIVLDLTEDGWIAHRYQNELWLFGLPYGYEAEGEDDAH